MAFRSSKFTGLWALMLSFILVIAISGLFYFFKIKQNENYQNQLHFRELNDMGVVIDNGVDQVREVLSQNKTRTEDAENFGRAVNALESHFDKVQNATQHFEQKQKDYLHSKAITEAKLADLQKKINKELSEKDNSDLEKKELDASFSRFEDAARQTKDALNELIKPASYKRQYDDKFDQILDAWDQISDRQQDWFFERCEDSKYSQDAFKPLCLWVEHVENQLYEKQFVDESMEVWDSTLEFESLKLESKYRDKLITGTDADVTFINALNAEFQSTTNSVKDAVVRKFNGVWEKQARELSAIDVASLMQITSQEPQNLQTEAEAYKTKFKEVDFWLSALEAASFSVSADNNQQLNCEKNPVFVSDCEVLNKLVLELNQSVVHFSDKQNQENKQSANAATVGEPASPTAETARVVDENSHTKKHDFTKPDALLKELLNRQVELLDKATRQKFTLLSLMLSQQMELNKASFKELIEQEVSSTCKEILLQGMQEMLLTKLDELAIRRTEMEVTLGSADGGINRLLAQKRSLVKELADLNQQYNNEKNQYSQAINTVSPQIVEQLGAVSKYQSIMTLKKKNTLDQAIKWLQCLEASFANNRTNNSCEQSTGSFFSDINSELSVLEKDASKALKRAENLNSEMDVLLAESSALRDAQLLSCNPITTNVEQLNGKPKQDIQVITLGEKEVISCKTGQNNGGKTLPVNHYILAVASNQKSLAVPFSDLLTMESSRYPLVLLVDNDGNRLVSKDNKELDAQLHGLNFESLDQALKALFAQQKYPSGNTHNKTGNNDGKIASLEKPAEKSPGYSGYVDIEITGIEYRLFITPYANNRLMNSNAEQQSYYLIGFKRKSQLNKEKLAVSDSLVVVIILIFLLLLSLIPFFKILLVSPKQSFTRVDRNSALLALIYTSGLLMISYCLYANYTGFKQTVADRGEQIFHAMKHSYQQEVSKLMTKAVSYEAKVKTQVQDEVIDNQLDGSYLENIFYISCQDKGIVKNGVLWSSPVLRRDKLDDIDLSGRRYYQKAALGSTWKTSLGIESSDFYAQRLFNKQDSRITTQFSLFRASKNDNCSDSVHKQDVFSFGTTLQTFFNVVLPRNFGFLVFDNHTGDIYYHDDNSRSLVENIFVETDNDKRIHALLKSGYRLASPTSILLDYRGKSHQFHLGQLVEGMPWTLVVYYDKSEARELVLLQFLVTVLVFIFVVSGIYALLLIAFKFFPSDLRKKLLWGRNASSTVERVNAHLMLLVGWCLAAALVAFGIAQFVSDRHLSRYQQIEEHQAIEDTLSSHSNIERYKSSVVEGATKASSIQANCFLGVNNRGIGACKPVEIEAKNDATDPESRTASPESISMEWLWEFATPLKINAQLWGAKHTIALPDNNSTVHHKYEFATDDKTLFFERLPENNWLAIERLLAVLLAITAVTVFIYSIKHIFVKRLYGSDLVSSFRVDKGRKWQLTHLQRKGLDKVQIVRPSEEIIQQLTQPSNGYFSQVHNISSLLEGTNSVEPLIKKLMQKSTEISVAEGERLQLLLSGFESVAMQDGLRKQSLDFLEQLVESKPDFQVVILCEIAPLYRLIRPLDYPCDFSTEQLPSSNEVIRWASLLNGFTKLYDWTAKTKTSVDNKNKPASTLEHEADGWPELLSVYEEFLSYHQLYLNDSDEIKTQLAKLKKQDISTYLQKGSELVAADWKAEQIVDFFAANAGALYRYRWELCTREERLLMYQIANNQQPNPLNREPLEHLMRRGYIYRDAGYREWHLINQSFQRFVLTAEKQKTYEHWMADAAESRWKYARIPFFALIIVVAAILAYTATDAIETSLSLIAGVLGLIPLATRSIGAGNGGETAGAIAGGGD